jgi:hypothetical protein
MEPMMISPNCPEHDRLVLDLALGRLDDESAAEAEAASETCPVCRTWWQTELGGENTALVDDAVASVFDDLELPDRRRGHGWLALAAAAVMALGAATLWLVQSPATQGPRAVEPVVDERVATIASMDFEAPSAVVALTSGPVEDASRSVDPVQIGDPRVDTQRLVTDEIVPADAVSGHAPVAVESEPLFAGRFESGDLGEWGPST